MDVRKSEITEYLKLSGKVESEYNGIEENDDNEGSETDVPYEVQNIRVTQKMITVFQIEHWISAENGARLNLSPEYQRNLVWDEKRKSALVPKNGVDSILVIYVFSSWYCIDLEE